MNPLTFWTAVSSIAVALAASFAFFEVRSAADRSRTRFEDELTREYRELMRALPFAVVFGDSSATPTAEEERTLVQYFDLCNHQIFHRWKGRVSKTTWEQWLDGIDSNMRRPAFRDTWAKVQDMTCDDFDELWMLMWPGEPAAHPPFDRDPHRWTDHDLRYAKERRRPPGVTDRSSDRRL